MIRKKGRARKPAMAMKAALPAKARAAKAAVPGIKVLRFPFGTIQIDKNVLVDLSCLFPPKPVKIIVIEGGEAHPDPIKLHRGYNPDRVIWFNKDRRGHTLKFANWPFREAPGAIEVPAHGYSGLFTVWASEDLGIHSYLISDGPPGEPEIEVVP